jgi:hypothetical protein
LRRGESTKKSSYLGGYFHHRKGGIIWRLKMWVQGHVTACP